LLLSVLDWLEGQTLAPLRSWVLLCPFSFAFLLAIQILIHWPPFLKKINSSLVYLLETKLRNTSSTPLPVLALVQIISLPTSRANYSPISFETANTGMSHLLPAIMMGTSEPKYFLSSKCQL
jgi:hypothetical protein